MTRRPLRVFAWIVLGLCAGCHFGRPSVDRRVDGRPIDGRYISVSSYSEYARGALLETTGDFAGAEAAYETARRDDPSSPELWTRLGAVRCAGGRESHSAFLRALDRDPEYAPAFFERARCALSGKRPKAAVDDARRAVELDPKNSRATDLFIDVQAQSGDAQGAFAWARAEALLPPQTAAKWERAAKLALAVGERDIAALSARRAASIRERLRDAGGAPPQCDPSVRSRLDVALREDRIDAARDLSTRCRLRPGQLAVRAAALGRARVAEAQALHVLGADDQDADAAIALWVARDLLGEPLPADTLPLDGNPSPLGIRLFAELLARRVGPDARDAWLTATGPLGPAADALERALDARRTAAVKAALPTP